MSYCRSILCSTATIVILGLVVWYGTDIYDSSLRAKATSDPLVKNAPRLFIKAHRSWRGYITIPRSNVRELTDSPLFGRSLYWQGGEWQKHIDERANTNNVYIRGSQGGNTGNKIGSAAELLPFAHRPYPADVQGAKRIPLQGSVDLAVFWRQGADDLHEIARLEARGSSEDTPREGEWRTLGELQTDTNYVYDVWAVKEGDHYKPLPLVSIYIESHAREGAHPFITYPLSWQEMRFFRRWGSGHADPEYVMELALPEGQAPVPVELYIGGHPMKEGMEYMKKGQFPPKQPIRKQKPES